MDPNEALSQIRKLIDEGNSDEAGFVFIGLDNWLTSGGFFPDAWRLAADRNRIIRPFDIMLCEECDTDREVATVHRTGVVKFRVCGHVQP
jgi:hypothetical protein